MNIAVNTRILLPNKLEGVGWFTRETLQRITTQHAEHTFYFFFDRKPHEEFIFADNVKPVVLSPQARHPILFYIWFQWAVTYGLGRVKADLFLSPDGFLSLRTNVRSVSVIHDLNFEHRPQDVPFLMRKYYHRFFPAFAKKATRIATVSEFSKKDIQQCYGIPENLIDVVYNGANEIYRPINDEQIIETRKKYTGGKPYFLFIGALLPRKNLDRLLLAFDAFCKEVDSEVQLVIVGQKKWWSDEMEVAYQSMQYRQDVHFLGRKDPDELKLLLGASLAITYVPLFEGFGIPILEGMQCGVPVICSSTSSMPEVAGDAALIVDPYSVDEITAAMKRLANDPALQKDLAAKGRERSKMFSWQQTSEKLWTCMEKAMTP
ncbi:MAG: glycosyltransferase family 4 protein [Flavobacteriales bacterium]|nr:glycosyltransferase family 4 protein [Flavobacteriales bacterium]